MQSPTRFLHVTLAKGIIQAAAIGSLTGILLATITLFWLNPGSSFYLPLMVAFWWLVIFGNNLWHAYILSNQRLSSLTRFGFQFAHAFLAAAVYFGIDSFNTGFNTNNLAKASTPIYLQADIAQGVNHALANSDLIVVVAFVLSLTTSGLLYSILSRPGAK